MATIVQRFREAPHRCPYLPDRQMSLEVALMLDVSPDELGYLLARGWRRFGPTYFKPACEGCAECVSLRVRADGFRASRSQKRARRLAAGLSRVVGTPVVDAERLALYERWHRQREAHRGWAPGPLDAERYDTEFAFEHPCVREVAFRDPQRENRLVGLGIVDEVPDGLSAVYFFWDPEAAPPSLGVAHVVGLIDEAAVRGLAYVYLGYRVADCPSLAYKARYVPHELLAPRDAGQAPAWRLVPLTGPADPD